MALKGVLGEAGRLENAMKKRIVKTRVSFLKFVGRLDIRDEPPYQNPATNRIGSFSHNVGTGGNLWGLGIFSFQRQRNYYSL